MNTKPNTNDAALATQLERLVEKKAYTYDTDSQKQANRQGMGWGETEAIIGKAPGLGIHTRLESLGKKNWRTFLKMLQKCPFTINLVFFSRVKIFSQPFLNQRIESQVEREPVRVCR